MPRAAWDKALALGEKHGYRNAQATVIAPTGTIGLVMDCDTTGIEPDFALVKFKKLAGGGYFKIINRAVPRRCARSATPKPRSPRSRPTPSATARWPGARHQPRLAQGQGLHRPQIEAVNAALARPPSTSSSSSTSGRWARTSAPDVLGITDEQAERSLRHALPSASRRRTSRPPTSMSAGR
jgi:ribonucleoside-diphosphate reductase alpha chain